MPEAVVGAYPRYVSFLFGLRPPDESESRDIDAGPQSQCFPLSPYIVERLFSLARTSNSPRGKELLQDLTANPRTRDAAEQMFELAVRYWLRNPTHHTSSHPSQHFKLTPLPRAGSPSTNVVGFVSACSSLEGCQFFSISELPEMIRKFPGRLLTPLQNTWPSVKYIMARYPNDSKSENGCSLVPIMEPHVYIIYPTLDEHPVLPVQELEKVRQAIPDGFLGFQWRNWSLIVVQLEQQGKGVMEPVTFTTGCSSMMNGNEKEMLNKWEKTLDQFTMTVSAERLFGLDPKQEKRGKMGVKL